MNVENHDNAMDISIIIVNWKSADYVNKCLETIYRNVKVPLFEVIVIDNASNDGCDIMLADRYPQARFVRSAVNVGFAEANNLAFRQSRGKTILFLNPDTEMIGDPVSTMHRLLWETPNAGAIGCTLLNSDRTLQTSCIQAFPTILNQALDAEALRRRFPLLSLWGTRPLFEQRGTPVPVDVVSGACLMVKRAVFEKAGLFSSDYFMYSEDTDLCFKIWSAGFTVYYTAAASVLHHGGGSSKQREHNNFTTVVMRESLLRFMTKYRGRAYSRFYRLTSMGAALVRLSLMLCLMAVIPRRAVREDLKISLRKWVTVLRWSLGLETWARGLTHEAPPA